MGHGGSMSVAYYIVLDKSDIDFDSFVNGKSLARAWDALSPTVKKLGLRDIEDFVSCDPEELADILEDLGAGDSVEVPEEQWFEPTEGLEWILKLSEYLQKNPKALQNSADVLSDLNEYKEVLEAAKKMNARWHFSVDF